MVHSSHFNKELLKWWSEFRKDNVVETNWLNRIWNNQEIRVFFIKDPIIMEFRQWETCISILTSILMTGRKTHIQKMRFLDWTGLRHSVLPKLRNAYHNPDYIALNPSFKIDCGLSDVTKNKSKDYYFLFVRKKACFPDNMKKLRCEFNLSNDALKKAFSLPHSVAFEPHVKAFQFKLLNSILYMNSKLHKIGTIADNLCSFCKCDSETMQDFFDFKLYNSSLTKQQIRLNLKDVLIGLLTPQVPLLNYLLPTGKIYLWGCRSNKELPRI